VRRLGTGHPVVERAALTYATMVEPP
jgi:hypothetical protein